MRKPLLLAFSLLALSGTGALAYWKLQPPPPPPAPSTADMAYTDIERAKMEIWMQELGYTE